MEMLCAFHTEHPEHPILQTLVIIFQGQIQDSAFLHRASTLGYKTIYATVDPDNLPSLRSFEKAGYRQIAEKNVYDGRLRVFVQLKL